jgi:dUTP pyrophosphatase
MSERESYFAGLRKENFPNENQWIFIRGLFDVLGNIANTTCELYVEESLASEIKNFSKIPCEYYLNRLIWENANAIDFLSKLYDGCDENYCFRKHKNAYTSMCGIGYKIFFKWCKMHENAVAPFKKRASDSGWDLTLIREVKKVGIMTLYGTGLSVQPIPGYYFDLVPRSNIINTGYIMANSIGIIDRTYTGEVMAALIKVDADQPDLVLPFRIVQIIPRPIIHAEFNEVDSLDVTQRCDGGFGSTNEKSLVE